MSVFEKLNDFFTLQANFDIKTTRNRSMKKLWRLKLLNFFYTKFKYKITNKNIYTKKVQNIYGRLYLGYYFCASAQHYIYTLD